MNSVSPENIIRTQSFNDPSNEGLDVISNEQLALAESKRIRHMLPNEEFRIPSSKILSEIPLGFILHYIVLPELVSPKLMNEFNGMLYHYFTLHEINHATAHELSLTLKTYDFSYRYNFSINFNSIIEKANTVKDKSHINIEFLEKLSEAMELCDKNSYEVSEKTNIFKRW